MCVAAALFPGSRENEFFGTVHTCTVAIATCVEVVKWGDDTCAIAKIVPPMSFAGRRAPEICTRNFDLMLRKSDTHLEESNAAIAV